MTDSPLGSPNHWDHLAKPFRPGQVIKSNRNSTECHFTFYDATGELYHNRFRDIPKDIAYEQMLLFVNKENGTIK